MIIKFMLVKFNQALAFQVLALSPQVEDADKREHHGIEVIVSPRAAAQLLCCDAAGHISCIVLSDPKDTGFDEVDITTFKNNTMRDLAHDKVVKALYLWAKRFKTQSPEQTVPGEFQF